jgi:lysyl-tRNA synthetase class 2
MTATTSNNEQKMSENQLIAERRAKLKVIRQANSAFPNDYHPEDVAQKLQRKYHAKDHAELKQQHIQVKLAGRMMLKRVMGKASFFTLQDGSGRIQVYVTRDDIGTEDYKHFKQWDLGDIVGAEGTLFKTRTGELSVWVSRLRLLSKSIRPLPDKFHGIHDQEFKYRQRYVELIMDIETKKRFLLRSQAIQHLRTFMLDHQFLEVETPMLHPIAGGANAKPFVTHHNSLDQTMYLRIAPELYLKRLIVGGFDKVFEINRSFRNEGISVRHNPEFTMLESYATYWDYKNVMDYTEKLIRHVSQQVLGTTQLRYQEHSLDLATPFARMTITEAITQYTDDKDHIQQKEWLVKKLKTLNPELDQNKLEQNSLVRLQVLYFEAVVEEKLITPTFICEHPTEISPLARAKDDRPEVTERFELYIAGREIANGFSELNDPEEQANRFAIQVHAKESGDDEAMFYDTDYIRALEYGMPSTGGLGIGIDRLIMLLTNSLSIRDVLFFPALRKETINE